MEVKYELENMVHISSKKGSGFEVKGNDSVLLFKVNDYNTFNIINFSIIFSLSLFNYMKERQDLCFFIMYGLLLLTYLVIIFFKKTASHNLITLNLKQDVLEIKNRSFFVKMFRKTVLVSFDKIESVYAVKHKKAGSIFVTVGSKEYFLLNVRSRKGEDSTALDFKTDGEIIADCLERIIIK